MLDNDKKSLSARTPVNWLSRAVLAAVLLIIMILPAVAHPPSQVSLTYDSPNQTLKVTITHQVSNPSSHYVYKISIGKNGAQVLTREYTSQPISGTFVYDYPINATSGDVLKAAAYCIIAGSKSGEINVGQDAKLLIQQSATTDTNGKASLPLEKIELPPSFQIEIYTQNLTYARSMALSPNGTLFVCTRRPFETIDSPNGSSIYAIVDKNNDNYAEPDEIIVIANGLNNPNGWPSRTERYMLLK